jgi:hypothetical protein
LPSGFRACFMDDALSCVWEKNGTTVRRAECDSSEELSFDVESYLRFIMDIKGKLFKFAYELFSTYAATYSLTLSEEDKDRLSEQMRNYQSGPLTTASD